MAAQRTEAGTAVSAREAGATQEEAMSEISVPPISIETDQPVASPTQDQLMPRFRNALGRPLSSSVEARQLVDGALEMTTQLGRFCARPPPAQSQVGVGGTITLAAPCAHF
jgi:hypothetical protein